MCVRVEGVICVCLECVLVMAASIVSCVRVC